MKSRIRKKLSQKLTVILDGFDEVNGWWIERHPEFGAKMMPRVGGHYDPYVGDCDDSVTVYRHVKSCLVHIMRDGEDQQHYPILKKRMTGKRVIETARKAAKNAGNDKTKSKSLHKVLAEIEPIAKKNYMY